MFTQLAAPKRPLSERVFRLCLIAGFLLQLPTEFRGSIGLHDSRLSPFAILSYLGVSLVVLSLIIHLKTSLNKRP